MTTYKLSKGDRLLTLMAVLDVGDELVVPFRFYSENSIRATVSSQRQAKFTVEARSNVRAVVRRVE